MASRPSVPRVDLGSVVLLSLASPIVLECAAQHGIAGLAFLTMPASRTERCVAGPGFQNNDCERHLAAGVRQGSEMEGEDDTDYVRQTYCCARVSRNVEAVIW